MKIMQLLLLGVALLLLQACAPKAYVIDSPEASSYVYVPDAAQDTVAIDFVDARADPYTPFNTGVLPMGLTHKGADLDPIKYIETFTMAEVLARGLPATSGSDAEVRINKIQMRNYRATGFSPFTTTTMLSADIVTAEGSQRAGAFFVRGKVPVWSFAEIVEPTLNQPLELLVQELAAKINVALFNDKASDSTVDELIAKVNADPGDGLAYLAVYQLGYTNNARAIDALVEMTGSEHQYVRLAAISSLGSLNAYEQIDHLISIFHSDSHWQDRAMAVKSLGDIAVRGNDRATAFLQDDVEPSLAGESAAGATWTREILGLYLRR